MYSKVNITLPLGLFEKLRSDSEKLNKIENAIQARFWWALADAQKCNFGEARNPYTENFPRCAEDIIKMAEAYALTGKWPDEGTYSGCMENKGDA